MATYYRTVREDIEIDAPTAAEATIYFEVGTHEAQTVTVSKGGGAFGATGGSVASQVDGTAYKLVIHADDADTLGDIAFKCAGATDTQYIFGLRVVNHNPFQDVAAILADTGTDGVVLGADAITAAKIADDAFSAEHFADDAIAAAAIATGALTADAFAADAIVAATLATDAITSDVLAATATAEIADAVLVESVSSNKGTSGGLADVVNDIWRRLGFGLRTYDSSAGTIKTYDGDADSDTLLLTETRSESGSEKDWTPS
jgi:hypothetical protein